jgi:phosphate:Na+ symporter
MIKHIVFFTLGGLGLFLFGMELLADGLKRTTGRKTRKVLSTLTSKPLMGVLAGALTTCIIQSSSATTVILVGFVNASLMTLK